MSEPTYTVELTTHQIGMIQRALRIAALSVGFDPLDVEHLRTHIAESVTDKEEQ